MFCRHKWSKISETTLPSAYEQLSDREFGSSKMPIWMFTKKYICILTCTKCGKIDKNVVEN